MDDTDVPEGPDSIDSPIPDTSSVLIRSLPQKTSNQPEHQERILELQRGLSQLEHLKSKFREDQTILQYIDLMVTDLHFGSISLDFAYKLHSQLRHYLADCDDRSQSRGGIHNPGQSAYNELLQSLSNYWHDPVIADKRRRVALRSLMESAQFSYLDAVGLPGRGVNKIDEGGQSNSIVRKRSLPDDANDSRTDKVTSTYLQGNLSIKLPRKNLEGDISQNIPDTPQEGESSSTRSYVIGGVTPLSSVIAALVQHGCQDMTHELDKSACGEYPVSSGGFGDVYCGRLKSGSTVAIKCMRIMADMDSGEHQKHLKHAAKEIHTWSKLDHPYVLKFLGLALFRGQIAMISPWAKSGTLPICLAKYPGLNRISLCMRIAEGLAFLHGFGVVHGDLKGANVLMSDTYEPLLTDFGNSTLHERSLKFTYTTSNKSLSPRWTAPELLDQGSYSTEADAYALGMTILEVITGAIPFPKLRDLQVMHAVINKRHPTRPEQHIPITTGGTALWALLTSCWSFEPASRPTAKQVQETVRELLSGYVFALSMLVDGKHHSRRPVYAIKVYGLK